MTADYGGDGEDAVPYRATYAIVSTYADVADMSFGWLERFLPDLVESTNTLLASETEPKIYLGTPDWKSKYRKYRAKSFAEGLAGLRDGTLDMFTVSTYGASMRAFLHPEPIEKRLVSTFELWLHSELTPSLGDYQERLLDIVIAGRLRLARVPRISTLTRKKTRTGRRSFVRLRCIRGSNGTCTVTTGSPSLARRTLRCWLNAVGGSLMRRCSRSTRSPGGGSGCSFPSRSSITAMTS